MSFYMSGIYEHIHPTTKIEILKCHGKKIGLQHWLLVMIEEDLRMAGNVISNPYRDGVTLEDLCAAERFDLDEESIAPNFHNAIRDGDLSLRLVESAKRYKTHARKHNWDGKMTTTFIPRQFQ
ncbi:hypothetical protein RND71_014412 [Anisodus tanguticus]|uniref:Uncharacterized protein n=1 Tax=Anisodus tanguticus TaxID=243964 RepID=A0AAE1VF10_9SOLA|nr:hypothetical protein RND71_014412 [Anisodus tanguticus]